MTSRPEAGSTSVDITVELAFSVLMLHCGVWLLVVRVRQDIAHGR